jgi:uncharacterized metal-binding protein
MPDSIKSKVGIVACSGEEMAEGTVTRQAALKVLERLRPHQTVTICLPLFLAGGEGDRTFARLYPTIAIDGCAKRCAARATEELSGKPAAGVVVEDLVAELGLQRPRGRRSLDEAGETAVLAVAGRVADLVDDLMGVVPLGPAEVAEPVEVACACGSGIPSLRITVGNGEMSLFALPLIFEQLHGLGVAADGRAGRELLGSVKLYNAVDSDDEAALAEALVREYATYVRRVTSAEEGAANDG